MTGDPEEERRRQERALEAAARHGELPDPVHVLRTHLAGDPPGRALYSLARWSLAARLVSDAAEVSADEVTDLGPDALAIALSVGPDDIGPGVLRHVGVAEDGRWLAWYPPVPPEPVPGSPGDRGRRN